MKTKIDLLGQKFGRLTVIENLGIRSGKRFWKCRCECGNFSEVNTSNLRSGNIISCRCAHHDSLKVKLDNELVGKTFGQLTVIERSTRDARGNYKWRCLCTCGKETFVRSSQLFGGNVSSCGCYRESLKVSDIEGKVFNHLTVIEYSHKDSNRTKIWKCRCICGNIVYHRYKDLVNGHVKSCGCKKAEYMTTHGLSKTPEYQRMLGKQRRDRSKLLDSEWTYDMELLIYETFDSCLLCEKIYDLTVDHVVPLSKGGKLEPGNVVVLCRSCNSKKYNKELESLPQDVQSKILTAAALFKEVWDNYVPEVYEDNTEDDDWEGWI